MSSVLKHFPAHGSNGRLPHFLVHDYYWLKCFEQSNFAGADQPVGAADSDAEVGKGIVSP